MKLRSLHTVAIVSVATAALTGCVSYGNTHALVTPLGAVGYHSFKPENSQPPREINLPEQRTPDQIAATNEQNRIAANNEQNRRREHAGENGEF